MELKNYKQILPLFVLRTAIGWLFLHEGLYKLLTPGWTAQYYLAQSEGPLQSLFQWVISSETLIAVSNYGVVIVLLITGFLLMTGFLERFAAMTGMVLLVFFYLSYPPFGEISDVMAEGNYLIVDKNFILFLVLWVIYKFRPGRYLGLNRLICNNN
ncbi:DoxX family membrane protein [Marinilabilia rubra]|uniref:DoxX family protein n=1 Tax=Marinilabilia rubra TaxID=2162893 RepID=A0A2U2B3A9_9BACT|nr:DoxX family membrane protein [Marinilabilia rubra]PWD97551.1 DoxX family protein [Marinilabilia rubra]